MLNYRTRPFKSILVAACLLCSVMLRAQDYDTVQSVEVQPPDSYYGNDESLGVTEKSAPFVLADEDRRHIEDTTISHLKSRDEYWYHNYEPRKQQEEPQPAKGKQGWLTSKWFRNLVWALIIAIFVGGLLWYLASSNIRIFRRTGKNLDTDTQEIAEDIFAIDYPSQIAAAVEKGDHRTAVRLHYLSLLRALSDRQLIDYTQEKTNSDYLFQLSSSHHYKGFFNLTRIFDYVWYGEFQIGRSMYDRLNNEFEQFKAGLHR